MKRLGLDPDSVDDKEEAVEAIYDKFTADGKDLEYNCPECGADLCEVEMCPFCGENLSGPPASETTEEAPEEKTEKKKRGRKKKEVDPNRVAGDDILTALCKEMEIPEENVHFKKSRVSLWTDAGLIAKCFTQAGSVRIHVPFLKEAYSKDSEALLTNFEKPIKNMYSRFTMSGLDDINGASTVLVETGKLKAADTEKKNEVKNKKKEEKKAVNAEKKAAEKEEKKTANAEKKEADKEEKKAAREAKKAAREEKKAKKKAEAAEKKEAEKAEAAG
ncbi:MAG: hypothetical protein KAS32_19835 [Candidatus Peribacteraceae bacterium]|nr:hypothetical protein [Candidatus Peribacteraceae bacterium]